MKITVVTVSFRAAGTLPTALESVWRQRTEGLEIEHIVVDGGSQDGTVALLRAHARRVAGTPGFSFSWTSQPDRGLYDAMNKGIARATGDIVGILNADDVFTDDTGLARLAGAFSDPQVDAAYADIRFVRGADATTLEAIRAQPTVRYYSSRRWRPWMHNWGFMPAHPTVYIRRRHFASLGLYRLGYRISADFELMVRHLCRGRLRAVYVPLCLVTMRTGGVSTRNWKANVRLNCENVRANRENGYFSCFPMMLPKYCFKIWGFVFRRRKNA